MTEPVPIETMTWKIRIGLVWEWTDVEGRIGDHLCAIRSALAGIAYDWNDDLYVDEYVSGAPDVGPPIMYFSAAFVPMKVIGGTYDIGDALYASIRRRLGQIHLPVWSVQVTSAHPPYPSTKR